MVEETAKERVIHKIFFWGILLKAFDGVVEVVGGVALLFTGTLTSVAELLIRNELLEDPHDFLAVHLQQALPTFLAQSGWFAALYLMSHGIIKIVLVAGLLRNKLWAYPSAIFVFSLFIVYQIYRYLYTHSIFLIILTVLDLVVIWLTWHEYCYFKKQHVFAK